MTRDPITGLDLEFEPAQDPPVPGGIGGSLNRVVADPAQPGGSFWPATIEEHRVLLAALEAELASALRTIREAHRCPHCGVPLVRRPNE